MLSRTCRIGLITCLMLVGFIVETKAQEPTATTTTTAASISPAKRQLIKELLELTGDQKSAEAIVNSMLDRNEKDMAQMMSRALDRNSPLTPAEQEKFKRDMSATMTRVSKRFRELFSQRVDFAKMIDDISYPIYDKFFSESELKDLIAFYKTPTGRKTIEVYPQLFSESMARTSELLLPKVRQIMDEIMEEEKTELEKLVKPLPSPTPPQPAGTKKRRRRG